MPPRKSPLEDARKRLQEKLHAIQEQAEYITQVLNSTVSKATNPANELLKLKDRKTFFQKYSQVSQDLEKCLDFLLVLSDSVEVQGEDEGTDEEDCNDDKEDSSNKPDIIVKEEKESQEEMPENMAVRDISHKHASSYHDKEERLPISPDLTANKSSCESSHKTKKKEKENPSSLDNFETLRNGCPQLGSRVDSTNNETNKSQHTQHLQTPPSTNENANVLDLTPVPDKQNNITSLKMPQVYSKNSKKDTHIKIKGSEGRISPSVGLPSAERARQSPTIGLQATGKKSPHGLEALIKKTSLTSKGKEKRGPPPNKVAHLKPYPFKDGQCLEVVVTEVLSPWEFWIQPTGNGFNLLMEKMCMHFAKAAASGYKGGMSIPPAVGDFCCARFLDDNTWYRVRVIGVYPSDDVQKQNKALSHQRKSSTSSVDSDCAGMEVEVLCVDDGNREKLPLSRLRPLEETLCDMPCQAICCALADVQPLVRNTVKSQAGSLWREESIEWLQNKVSGVKLLAYLTRTKDKSLIMVDMFLEAGRKKAVSGRDGTIPGRDGSIPGQDTMSPGLQYSIAHIMVSEGFAQHIGSLPKPSNIKPSSPPAMVNSSEKCLPNSSSLITKDLQESSVPGIGLNVLHSKFMQDCARLVSDENISKVTQEDLDDMDNGSRNEVYKQVDSIKKDKQPSSTRTENCDSKSSKALQSTIDTPSEQVRDVTESDKLLVEQVTAHDDGSQCRKESVRHSPEGSSLSESIHGRQEELKGQWSEHEGTSVSMPTQEQPILLQVMMSEVVTPSEFYVHLVTSEAALLKELTGDLQSHYEGTDAVSTPSNYCLSVGNYCCAKFSQDDMWCRAKVLDVQFTPSGDGEDPFDQEVSANIHVFYLDYGNCEWVSMDNTRPLLPKFMLLPGFAVKCRLSGVQPVANQVAQEDHQNLASKEFDNQPDAVQSTTPSSNQTNKQTPSETSTLQAKNNDLAPSLNSHRKSPCGKGRKKKRNKLPLNKEVILRAAGDESGDSELSDGGLVLDFSSKNEEKDQIKTDTRAEKESALPERYLLPSPTKTPSSDFTTADKTVDSKAKLVWSEESIELFKGLTDDDKPLQGVMVPWRAIIYQQIYYPNAGKALADITYQRPLFGLRLYDTTGEEDIDVAQVMVETGLAELCDDEQSLVGEDYNGQEPTGRTLHLTVADLETTAAILEQEGSLLDGSASDTSDEEMNNWNPMMDDYRSSRNSYKINTDDVDIAVHGFKPIETQYCRFFRNPNTRCWRGDNCPMLHVKEGDDTAMKVQAFSDNNDFIVDLPKLDSWVGVRVTAVLNPGHFWVQLPCGSDPIEKKIIEERLGLTSHENSNDEDFEGMMERMNNFYKKNLFRDATTILPAVGELVVAKYSLNERWYRARITDVFDDKLKVTFVDFGNSEWSAESNVKRMLPQFLHLPFQAVECFLCNVEAIEEDGEWSAESLTVFESLTQDKLLIAHVLSIHESKTMYIELFDTANDPEININEKMVQEGFAVESDVKITLPTRTRPTGTPSAGNSPDSSGGEVILYPG